MDNDSGTGLPASLEAAWGLRERPGRGPRRGLSLDRIVAAAVEIAETEGLAAVSMGRVAKQLGSSPMSLYRYVSAKDELLLLMVDAATGPPPAPPGPDTGWRAAITAWARAHREVLLRRHWILRIPISGPPITPNTLAWMEQGLAALRHTWLPPGDKMSVLLLVTGFVRNEATLTTDIREATAGTTAASEVLRSYSTLLRKLTDARTHPHLHEVVTAGVFEDEDDDYPDYDFRFGLERLLDGVETLVRTREHLTDAPPAQPGPAPA
ncbi:MULTISPECIES: TetR/AcrR family transcriptional regulator [Streptomyces]|uniref:TetR/AcrR family transcriptional regulator n=1 Tax=Streptomyces lycii TaxID=2654337 RepID=A0ABQ7FHK6_9ACTN|nr:MULTISPECIES: TetR/AcrR family transcriptional regulator [Streptomyces]KAF4407134.1 TetR/AcrR family transcriptional regulator [Streptomyces lycii]PGH49147.1 TetR family transcriptional regulator [Streptomyces sp. Ru87]